MTDDRERWAEALALKDLFGESAWQWVSTEIAVLASGEDRNGVRRLKGVADRMNQALAASVARLAS